jgi:hypothetical protein
VITLVGEAPAAAPRALPLEATAPADAVVLRDASGRRSQPVSWSELTANALVLSLPGATTGARGAVTMWRKNDGVRAARPTVTFVAPVREDGTIALAGIAPGDYDVQVAFGAGAAARTWTRVDVAAPGDVVLVAAPVR